MTSRTPLRWERQANGHLWAYSGYGIVAAVGRLDEPAEGAEYHWQTVGAGGTGFAAGSCRTEEEAQQAAERALPARRSRSVDGQ
jgi:hypothetical protein